MRRISLAALALLLCGALPEAARADALVAFEGSVVTYNGAAAEPHQLVVSGPTGQVEFKEPGVIAGSGCTQVAADKVHCPRSIATGIRVVLGGEDDELTAGKGVDLPVDVFANDGDDVIRTGRGSDTVRGGPGNDRIEPGEPLLPGASEFNNLSGGDGDDTFLLGRSLGADRVVGGTSGVSAPVQSATDNAGIDTADYSSRPPEQGGVAVSTGSAGPTLNNAFVSSDGRLNGTEGDDIRSDVERIVGTGVRDVLELDNCDLVNTGGSDQLRCFQPAARPRLTGNAGDDELRGGLPGEDLFGGVGADMLDAFRGDDTADGGSGNDLVIGGPTLSAFFDDTDTVKGGTGNDELRGGNRGDTLEGGSGNDVVFGGRDDDEVSGGTGDDSLHGDDGDDGIEGDDGVDSLFGEAGRDRLHGGDDGDTLAGGDGDDDVFGEGGADTAGGGPGLDDIFLRDGIADRCFVPSTGHDDIDADLADQPLFSNSLLCSLDFTASLDVSVGFSPVDELPSVRVRQRRLRIHGGRAVIRLGCPKVRKRYPCRGRIRLAAPRGRPVLARGRYRVRAGRRRPVKLRLSRSARRRLARAPSVRVTLVGRGRSRKGPTTIHVFLRPPRR
jgi:Ca2+-binding RTX toxin-like protein